MHILDYVVPSFAAGGTVGFGLAFLRFRSRLKFYRVLIEQRLAAINQRLVDSHASAQEGSHVA